MRIFIKPSEREKSQAVFGMEHRAYETGADRRRAITMFRKLCIRCIDYRDTQAKFALVIYRKSFIYDIMNS